jgi:hypothetical protein
MARDAEPVVDASNVLLLAYGAPAVDKAVKERGWLAEVGFEVVERPPLVGVQAFPQDRIVRVTDRVQNHLLDERTDDSAAGTVEATDYSNGHHVRDEGDNELDADLLKEGKGVEWSEVTRLRNDKEGEMSGGSKESTMKSERGEPSQKTDCIVLTSPSFQTCSPAGDSFVVLSFLVLFGMIGSGGGGGGVKCTYEGQEAVKSTILYCHEDLQIIFKTSSVLSANYYNTTLRN